MRLRSLGDCVLSTPALQILRQARPDVRIAIAVQDEFATVFEGNPDLDVILPPEIRALRQWRPRLCLNLHGGSASAALTVLSGARFRAGFAHFRYGYAYNVRIPRAQEILGVERKVHTAEHVASAIFYLGAPQSEIPRAKLFTTAPRASDPYAVLHPFASRHDKTWPARGFIEVAEYLRRSCDLEPVFIGGPRDNFTSFGDYRVLGGAPLSEIKNLLAGASLFVGNDSGPAHMAAAFQLPAVVIFGASDVDVWGPWRTAAEVIKAGDGIASVRVEQVIDALARLRVHA